MANFANAVTDNDFETVVLGSDQPVLVDFWAEWCGPCRMIAPSVEAVAEEYDGKATFVKMDVDDNQNVPAAVWHSRHSDAYFVQRRPGTGTDRRRGVAGSYRQGRREVYRTADRVRKTELKTAWLRAFFVRSRLIRFVRI